MKKLVVIAGILVLGALGWGAATHVVGTQVEQRYFSFLEKHRQYGPVTLTGTGYQRGFLTSRATTVADIPLSEEASLRLKFAHTLRHGPLPAWRTLDGEIRLEPMLALVETRLAGIRTESENSRDILADIPKLGNAYAFTLFGLSGGGLSRAYIPPLQAILEKVEGRLDWQGLAAEAEFSQGMSTLEGFVNIPGADLKFSEGRIELGKTTSEFDLYQPFPGVFLGQTATTLREIRINGRPDVARDDIRIRQIEATTDSRRDENKVRATQVLKIAGIDADGGTYGPGLLEISLRGLDGMVLSRLQQETGNLQRQLAGLSPEEFAERVLPTYLQLCSELLQGSPQFEIQRLHIQTPQGDVEGRARVTVDGQALPGAGAPVKWLQALQADARIAVAEKLLRELIAADLRQKMIAAREREEFPPFSEEEIAELAAEQTAGQIESLLQQGLLVRKGEELIIEASFEKSTLQLNGQAISLQ